MHLRDQSANCGDPLEHELTDSYVEEEMLCLKESVHFLHAGLVGGALAVLASAFPG